jgi:hypothetical protein
MILENYEDIQDLTIAQITAILDSENDEYDEILELEVKIRLAEAELNIVHLASLPELRNYFTIIKLSPQQLTQAKEDITAKHTKCIQQILNLIPL